MVPGPSSETEGQRTHVTVLELHKPCEAGAGLLLPGEEPETQDNLESDTGPGSLEPSLFTRLLPQLSPTAGRTPACSRGRAGPQLALWP